MPTQATSPSRDVRRPQAGPTKVLLVLGHPRRGSLCEALADAYAAELMPHFELFANDALQLAALPAGARIIDVATGPGTLALLAARSGAAITAIDFSPTMIANLNRRAIEAGTAIEAISVREAPALHLRKERMVHDLARAR